MLRSMIRFHNFLKSLALIIGILNLIITFFFNRMKLSCYIRWYATVCYQKVVSPVSESCKNGYSLEYTSKVLSYVKLYGNYSIGLVKLYTT